jgi:hypothetical protein
MEAITLPYILQILGMLCAGFGFWYKTVTDTERKIEKCREAADSEIKTVKADIASIRAGSISRIEHDQDIENVKHEIRAFRDEVRDDIKSLNVTMTTRFDLMMQKIIEFRFSQKE